MKNYTLLISCPRNQEKKAASEMWYLLNSEFDDPQAECEITEVSGLIAAITSLDPFEVIRKIKNMIQEDPWQIRYALKLVPLEKVVSTSTSGIVEAVKDLSKKITEDEKFRINVNRRHTKIDRMTLIKAVADVIDRKVDLENPDKIMNIEIVGNWTGISVLKPDDIFSIGKERQF
ncbi:MAG: THUMP domain-containing protein [Promethearchaeota archaeon]